MSDNGFQISHKIRSKHVGEEILCARWGTFGQPVLLFPTAGGDGEECDRFKMIYVLKPKPRTFVPSNILIDFMNDWPLHMTFVPQPLPKMVPMSLVTKPKTLVPSNITTNSMND